jgi:hypothetical protein
VTNTYNANAAEVCDGIINKLYKNLKNMAKFVTDQQNLSTAMYFTHATVLVALIYGLLYEPMFDLLVANFNVR